MLRSNSKSLGNPCPAEQKGVLKKKRKGCGGKDLQYELQ